MAVANAATKKAVSTSGSFPSSNDEAALKEDVGDKHEEQHPALKHKDRRRGEPGRLQTVPSYEYGSQENRHGKHSPGVETRQPRNNDGRITIPRGELSLRAVEDAGNLRHAC